MRIAITYANGNIFQHFGHTKAFKIYDIENGAIVKEQIVNTMGNGHGALAGFLTKNQVNVVICGGIGGGAQMALAEAGIQLYGGVNGDADEAIHAYLSGNLQFQSNVQCNHHQHAHACGQHPCGENKHGCTGKA